MSLANNFKLRVDTDTRPPISVFAEALMVAALQHVNPATSKGNHETLRGASDEQRSAISRCETAYSESAAQEHSARMEIRRANGNSETAKNLWKQS